MNKASNFLYNLRIIHKLNELGLRRLIRLIKWMGLWSIYIALYSCLDTIRYATFRTNNLRHNSRIWPAINKLELRGLIWLIIWVELKFIYIILYQFFDTTLVNMNCHPKRERESGGKYRLQLFVLLWWSKEMNLINWKHTDIRLVYGIL